jgi:hypothetical protein
MASNTNLFSDDLTPDAVAKIRQHLVDIRAQLPFLRSIPEGQANHLRKRKLDDAALIAKGGRAVAQLPDVMPGLFAKAEFVRDAALLGAMAQVLDEVNGLRTLIDDTARLLHSETSEQQGEVYAAFQQAARKNAEARTLFQDMELHKKKAKAKPTLPTI